VRIDRGPVFENLSKDEENSFFTGGVKTKSSLISQSCPPESHQPRERDEIQKRLGA
jgi:hypothetical protein